MPEEKLISTTDLPKSQEDVTVTISVLEIEEGIKPESAHETKLQNPYLDKNNKLPIEETAL